MAQSRRQFLCNCGITMGGLALAFDRFSLMNAFAQASDYKALVCVFLNGGNDSGNVIIPYDNYAEYAAVRVNAASLQIPQTQLRRINPRSHGATFGFHPALGNGDADPPTGLHSLWRRGKVAAVCNVGPLVQPLTRNEYLARPDLRPLNLFSHSDQQSQWQTSISDRMSASGWGGRVADKTAALNSGNVRFPMMVTVNAVTIFTTGEAQQSLAFAPGGAQFRLEGFPNPPDNDARYQAMRQLLELDRRATPTLLRGAAMKMDQAVENARELATLPAVGPFPGTSLGSQLMRVAQLIKLNRQSPTMGLSRQLFFCQLGGFDTHANQAQGANPAAGTHANLWAQVSNAMKAFYDETEAQGIESSVVTFTLSDFARTFKPNGNLGTDHGWGAHQLVMGGGVAGGDFYGKFPPLALGAGLDTDSGGGARGRWIPTTAVDQYGATLASWYGVSAADLPAVFPNLNRFSTPNLAFV
jgi:uncharacterized protein (DUF1501 family)